MGVKQESRQFRMAKTKTQNKDLSHTSRFLLQKTYHSICGFQLDTINFQWLHDYCTSENLLNLQFQFPSKMDQDTSNYRRQNIKVHEVYQEL